jgi:hypothetical protein
VPLLRSVLALAFTAVTLWAADALFESAWNKFERIDSGRAPAGSVTVFTPAEINAFARGSMPRMMEGLRNPQVQLGNGTATATAVVDLLKMRGSERGPANPFVTMLLEGERPVKVTVRVESSNGTATVYLTGVEISGVTASGRALDFLMSQIFLPLFPDARVNQPFELRDDIDHIDLRPDGVRVTMRR